MAIREFLHNTTVETGQQWRIYIDWRGIVKANVTETKRGRVFNVKLGCFTAMQVVHHGIDLLHPNVVPKLRGGWQHNYSAKTRQAGCANEQSI